MESGYKEEKKEGQVDAVHEDTTIRTTALLYAIQTVGGIAGKTKDVLATAELFYRFLKGDGQASS